MIFWKKFRRKSVIITRMTKRSIDDYLFDLRGYLVLKNAVEPELLGELNAAFDAFPDLPYQGWWGNVHRLDNNGYTGVELQNIVEAGGPFETLIDHPSWYERLLHYCGEYESYVEGLFIDECFASIRRQGGFFPMHSGAHEGNVRNQYKYYDGHFRCGQVNILLALTDVGPGDGATMVIPGSHKSSFAHPEFEKPWGERLQMDSVEGAIEVHLKAGDALMFSDALSHGAASRTNAGERRVVIYRYGPSWGSTRHGYRYSDELLARLTPRRRRVLQPIAPRQPGGLARAADAHVVEG
jgi:ectoine hydroxylase-related dioxygenase (phytanoyl-CoA dioxygenase family)